MIKMISKGGHRYGTRMMTAGEEFEVRGQSDVKLFTALKWAEVKTEEEKAPEPVKPPPSEETEPLRVKRSYVRRNMTAKDF